MKYKELTIRVVAFFSVCLCQFLVMNLYAESQPSSTDIDEGTEIHLKMQHNTVHQIVGDKAIADSAYEKKNYKLAIACYEKLLEKGFDKNACYNLGNAYYRHNDLAHAILNYERVLKFEPSDKDARHNLEICQSKLGISKECPSGMFFVTWTNQFIAALSADQWGKCSLIFFVLLSILLVCHKFVKHVIMRKCVFYASSAVFCIFIITFIFACIQLHRFQNRKYAIVMYETIIENESGKKEHNVIRPGTKVEILREGVDSKLMIQTQDGLEQGWAPAKHLESI